MAKAYISEYRNLVTDESGRVVQVAEEPAVTQAVTYTTSVASAAFQDDTRFVGIIADAKAHLLFALIPVADADDPFIAANVTQYYGVPRGRSYKVAAYDGSS